MAIVASEFEKVIWIDSDAFLVQNISSFIRQASKSSAIFWHDIWAIHEKNPVWGLLNRTKAIRGPSQESGIVFINKATSWRGLYTTAYMNQKQPMYYSLVWGDKDTFFLGYEAMNERYSFIPYSPLLIGKSESQLKPTHQHGLQTKFIGYSFVQLDMNGRPLCVHLVSGKKFITPFLKKGERLFTLIRSFDPNTAHIAPVGDGMYDITIDEGSFYGPLWDTDQALGQFEEHLIQSYQDAVKMIGNKEEEQDKMRETIRKVVKKR